MVGFAQFLRIRVARRIVSRRDGTGAASTLQPRHYGAQSMRQKSIITFSSALLMGAFVAQVTVGGTDILAASSNKRRVDAVVDTTTAVVREPIVEKKIEGTETWIVDTNESIDAELDMLMEEPFKPYIPIATALVSNDCNDNLIDDDDEIEFGEMDFDNDGILDVCEYRMGDLNLNGVIDAQDVSILLGWWGIPNPVFGDLDGDEVVGARDLGILLGRFGVVMW
jgi:hypothetical protein